MGNDFKDKRQRKVTVVLFGAYLLMLIWIVVFKLQIPGSMGPLPYIRGINLIPFYYSVENELHLKEVLYNMVVFIPFGIFSGIFLSDKPLSLRCFPAFFISLIFESAQFVFHIGASDIQFYTFVFVGNTVNLSVLCMHQGRTKNFILLIIIFFKISLFKICIAGTFYLIRNKKWQPYHKYNQKRYKHESP